MNLNGAFTEQEKYQFKIITLCLQRQLTTKQAAMNLQRSVRQVQRIKVAVRIRGILGVVHGLKGNVPIHLVSLTK
jgi:hypothetical protein